MADSSPATKRSSSVISAQVGQDLALNAFYALIFVLVGAIIAAAVFAISVVSIPMMLDRKTDFVTAVLTSLTAVRANPGPMVLWAALIVIFTGIGLLTFYLGLALALPLIGHATWHAYRDLVEDGDLEQQPL